MESVRDGCGEATEAAVSATLNGRCYDSVELLVKLAAALKRMDRSAEFERNLEVLGVKDNIRRNFGLTGQTRPPRHRADGQPRCRGTSRSPDR